MTPSGNKPVESIRHDVENLSREVERTNSGIAELKGSVESHKKEIEGTNTRIAELKGTIDSLKSLFAIFSSLVALIFGVGAFDYLKNRAEIHQMFTDAQTSEKKLKEVQQTAASVTAAYADVSQSYIVDRIEAVLNEQESLDSLKHNEAVTAQLNAFKDRLKEIAPKIEDTKRTTYHFLIDAIEPYNRRDYAAALRELDNVKDKDRSRLTYAYMRGVCLLRTGKTGEAASWFVIAGSLTSGKRHLLVMNAQGISKMYEWRKSREPEKADAAINLFEAMIKIDDGYAIGHFNLAVSLTAKGPSQNKRITYELMYPVEKSTWTMGDLLNYMQDDLTTIDEHFLEEYVINYLGVKDSVFNVQVWRQNVARNLREKRRNP